MRNYDGFIKTFDEVKTTIRENGFSSHQIAIILIETEQKTQKQRKHFVIKANILNRTQSISSQKYEFIN